MNIYVSTLETSYQKQPSNPSTHCRYTFRTQTAHNDLHLSTQMSDRQVHKYRRESAMLVERTLTFRTAQVLKATKKKKILNKLCNQLVTLLTIKTMLKVLKTQQ